MTACRKAAVAAYYVRYFIIMKIKLVPASVRPLNIMKRKKPKIVNCIVLDGAGRVTHTKQIWRIPRSSAGKGTAGVLDSSMGKCNPVML